MDMERLGGCQHVTVWYGRFKAKLTTRDVIKMSSPRRDYPDLHDHIEALDKAGLLVTVNEPVDKDSEMHALVRWQFVGGLKESERRAFLFKNVVNAKGRKYELPIVVGALAANQDIYSIGMGVPAVSYTHLTLPTTPYV